ncbi:MAG TPA: SRPBCC family protein [Solirubrobacteraceae bacterium]|nr:SRPBCC family protein [Solirubrobacteraceae bacterium]
MTGLESSGQINAVTRRVGSGEFRAGEARMVTLARSFDAPIEDVWDACTNPERIPRWFLPVSGELREGGRYQVQGNAGGLIERCEPPRGFAATWEFGGQVSWIELRLSDAAGGGTRFELEHIAHVSDHWAQFGPGAVGVGWDLALLGLTQHLVTGALVDREAGLAFPATDEGRRFIEASSRGWCEAAIAAGADAAEATAAAERTFAFFTGTGPAA